MRPTQSLYVGLVPYGMAARTTHLGTHGSCDDPVEATASIYAPHLLPFLHSQTKQFEMQAEMQGLDTRASCAAFLRQMGYREYSRYLAFFFPFIHERSLLSHLRHCPWRLDQAAFKVGVAAIIIPQAIPINAGWTMRLGWIERRLRRVWHGMWP